MSCCVWDSFKQETYEEQLDKPSSQIIRPIGGLIDETSGVRLKKTNISRTCNMRGRCYRKVQQMNCQGATYHLHDTPQLLVANDEDLMSASRKQRENRRNPTRHILRTSSRTV